MSHSLQDEQNDCFKSGLLPWLMAQLVGALSRTPKTSPVRAHTEVAGSYLVGARTEVTDQCFSLTSLLLSSLSPFLSHIDATLMPLSLSLPLSLKSIKK